MKRLGWLKAVSVGGFSVGEVGMHFLLLLVRMILDRLTPHWRDGLKMAARKDGRVEHWHPRPSFWSHWLRVFEEAMTREDRKPKKPCAACSCAPGGPPAQNTWPRN
jgi:hypothetical protein